MSPLLIVEGGPLKKIVEGVRTIGGRGLALARPPTVSAPGAEEGRVQKVQRLVYYVRSSPISSNNILTTRSSSMASRKVDSLLPRPLGHCGQQCPFVRYHRQQGRHWPSGKMGHRSGGSRDHL